MVINYTSKICFIWLHLCIKLLLLLLGNVSQSEFSGQKCGFINLELKEMQTEALV